MTPRPWQHMRLSSGTTQTTSGLLGSFASCADTYEQVLRQRRGDMMHPGLLSVTGLLKTPAWPLLTVCAAPSKSILHRRSAKPVLLRRAVMRACVPLSLLLQGLPGQGGAAEAGGAARGCAAHVPPGTIHCTAQCQSSDRQSHRQGLDQLRDVCIDTIFGSFQ